MIILRTDDSKVLPRKLFFLTLYLHPSAVTNFIPQNVFGLNITLHPNIINMNMKIRPPPPLNHSSSDLLHFPSIN